MTGGVSTLGYTVLEETWGEYLLPNGIRLKSRAVLTFLRQRLGEIQIEGEEHTGVLHEARSTMNVAVLAPEELTGSAEDNPETREVVETFDEFEVLANPRSFYYVEDTGSFIVLKADRPERIELTNHVDQDGQPIIQIRQARHAIPTGPTRADVDDRMRELLEGQGIELPEGPSSGSENPED